MSLERRNKISEALRKLPASIEKQKFLERAAPQLCACGCGEYAKVDERRNRVSKFVSGHNARTAHPMQGKHHTEEAKRAIAAAAHRQMVEAYPERQPVRDNPGTHNSWKWMMSRCFDSWNASYEAYGAKGITVCERWLVFDNFLADMGPRPAGKSIDRIDNDRGYERGNCRWATAKEQRANQKPRGKYGPRKTGQQSA